MSIAPHVHDRDEKGNETAEHALEIAYRAGESAIFVMPNTSTPIDTYHRVERKLKKAVRITSSVFYGLYAGVTSSPKKIRQIVKAYRDFFPRKDDMLGVIGLKMFAGRSVGPLSVIEEDEQRSTYRHLNSFYGVLALHCEKESLLRPKLWDPKKPITHCRARPPEAEIASIEDQISFAREENFPGHLHILHVSTPESVRLVRKAKEEGMSISCGVTPHHCLLNERYMTHENGLLYKVNPPLRSRATADGMLSLLLDGQIDFIESDHAPHPLTKKTGDAIDPKTGKRIYMSGFPGLAFRPWFTEILITRGLSEQDIEKLTHTNIEEIFGIKIPHSKRTPEMGLHMEYPVDVHAKLRERFELNGFI